ncbi:hypothetical protein EGW08_013584 [Elysia chlorotica]|uniref:Uncharacterized protein n=1 Tax=Elysia chlorotica TaxID=188477 RepID=A0A433TAN8_ELYCH|nr:hypothetical protein EGW08_013584 [Elysia chlorotica]
MVSLVLQDSSVSNTKALSTEGSSPTNKLSQKQAVRQESRTLSVERSEEWVKATASKVKVIVEQMSRLVTHDNWRVRLGLAEGWEKLLTACCRSLSESVPKILETLVGLINDPFGNVAKKATAALEAFSAATKSDSTMSGGRTLMGILKENLYALATSLPRQIKMCDEEEKPALMRLLNGYISLLGTDINSVINSSPHLNRLCLALVLILDLDVRDLRIVEERGRALDTDADTFVDEQSCAVWKPRKYFKHFRDESILSESLLACRQLGRFGNIYILVDHLLDIHQTSSAYHLATTLIINEMVLGAGCLEGENVSSQEPSKSFNTDLLPDVISMLMEEYLSERNLRLLDTVTAGPPVLGPARQEHLIRTLYPLVENLGHENLYISCTAYSALVEFAASGGYRTLDCLLRENADYLVSSVSLRLRHFQVNRRTPQTLCVMLKYCSKELLPHMRRSVTQLLDSLDDNYTDDLVLFMPVLLELVRAVCRWFPPPLSSSAQDSVSGTQRQVCPCDEESKKHCLNAQELKDFLEDYVATKRIAEGDFSDEKTKESMTLEEIEREIKALAKESEEEKHQPEQAEEEEDKEKEVPSHIVLVKEVFHRVRNLLSTRDGRLRVQALDVVSQGIQALKGQERELLPQVHQMWAGFRPLFNSQEKFIVVKAVKTLLVLSEAAGDFLRQRTVKEIIPGLSSFMDKQASISCDCHSGYLHTANYKLQLCILSTVGQLASNLELDRNHLDQVARLCVPYLSDAQPHTLQQAALSSFSHFVRLDADACWLMLTHIYSPWSLTPPGPQFVPVKLPPGASKKNPYSSNISKIFAEYYEAEEYFGTPST